MRCFGAKIQSSTMIDHMTWRICLAFGAQATTTTRLSPRGSRNLAL
jgi:hypothetical protein